MLLSRHLMSCRTDSKVDLPELTLEGTVPSPTLKHLKLQWELMRKFFNGFGLTRGLGLGAILLHSLGTHVYCISQSGIFQASEIR